jgi:hypothetical protein
LRHIAYAGGWKRFEPLWDAVIRAKRVLYMLPMLETILEGFGRLRPGEKMTEKVIERESSVKQLEHRTAEPLT